jgi:hypothetical protein
MKRILLAIVLFVMLVSAAAAEHFHYRHDCPPPRYRYDHHHYHGRGYYDSPRFYRWREYNRNELRYHSDGTWSYYYTF